MEKNSNLKPCPFCAGDAELHTKRGFHQELIGAWVQCKECCVNTPTYQTEESAVEHWNSRKKKGVTQRELIDFCNSQGPHCDAKQCKYAGVCDRYIAKFRDSPYEENVVHPERYTEKVI